MSQINMSVHNAFLIYDKSWQQYINTKSNEIIASGVNKRPYDIQLVTIKICYCNDIDFIQEVLHVCLKI